MSKSTIRGQGKLRRALRRLPKEVRAEMGDVLEVEAKRLRDMIADRAPKEHGDMGRAVKYKLANDKLSARVGYSPKRPGFKRAWKKGGFPAIWQEFGTKHHAAQPFLRPSFRQRLPAIKSEMRKALNNMLARARTFGS